MEKQKRPRTHMRGLCSHTTPTSSYMGETEKLHKKFLKGGATQEEQYKLAFAFAAISGRRYNDETQRAENRTPKSVLISVFGHKKVLTYAEYKEFGKDFPIIEAYY